jgi:hypothetical protein
MTQRWQKSEWRRDAAARDAARRAEPFYAVIYCRFHYRCRRLMPRAFAAHAASSRRAFRFSFSIAAFERLSPYSSRAVFAISTGRRHAEHASVTDFLFGFSFLRHFHAISRHFDTIADISF